MQCPCSLRRCQSSSSHARACPASQKRRGPAIAANVPALRRSPRRSACTVNRPARLIPLTPGC
eukprot:scaffold6711_cov118-Isochrysis_galbana.AAC.22